MKHKYNIKIDAQMPSDTQVDRHKDFNRLLANYETLTQPLYRKPLYKNPKALLGLMLIVTVAMLLFWQMEQDEKQEEKNKAVLSQIEQQQAQSFLQPPIKGLELASLEAAFDPKKGLDWQVNPQLKLKLPPNSLAIDGQQGKLELKTSNQASEWIAQGLPMESPEHLLNCLQVVEARLSLDGRPVQLQNGSLMELSFYPPAGYEGQAKVYALDTAARKWQADPQSVANELIDSVGKPRLDDGFTVIEFDDQGRRIPKPQPQDEGKLVKVIRYQIKGSGYFALAEEAVATTDLQQVQAKFVNEQGQPLPVLSIYALPEKSQGLQLFFPKNAEYLYDLRLRKDCASLLLAFLPDGRLAYTAPQDPIAAKAEVMEIEMKEIDAPVNNIDALTQRLRDLQGL